MFRLSAVVIVALVGSSGPAHAEDPAPYRVSQPAEGVSCFSPGLETPPITTCIIETEEGLVLVDTGLSPTMARRTRARIAEATGREDIRWVLNTHSHFDHTGGNQVFADARIIGHENAAAEMLAFSEGREAWIQRRHVWLARQEQAASDAAPGSPEAVALSERLQFNREMIADLGDGYRSTPPSLTFSDRLNLTAGKLEIRLLYFGRAHTKSDMLIHVPDLGVLFTGDLFHDEVLGAAAGPQPLDVQRWLDALDAVLAEEAGVETVIGGHGLLFTPQWLRAQRHYMGVVWEAVQKAKAQGLDLEGLNEELAFDERFAFVAERLGPGASDLEHGHRQVLETFWRVGQLSAAEELGRIAREDGADAVQARWPEVRSDSGYYLDERELNALGYRLLQQEQRVPEALAVFKINTEAFPNSWNVWDSYAEAHWWINDEEGVETHYRKALELNPEAESARRGISQIEGYRLDRAGETGMASAFEPGSPTGLEGLYFGQDPPGTTPELFAPGIVSTAEGFEYSISFSPDGREVFFTRRIEPDGHNTIWAARLDEGGWTAPEPVHVGANEPHISPDGQRLFFGRRPPEGPGPGIWVCERRDDGWAEPEFWGRGMFASATGDGDLFMWDPDAGRGGAIVHYPRTDDGWGSAERLGGGVNAPLPGVHGWVSPDGGSIVFDSYQRPGAQGGEGDLFVSFRRQDGTWGDAHNLGDDINSPGTNFCPALSPDGKYLFFATNRDIYWVGAEVIHRLRPE